MRSKTLRALVACLLTVATFEPVLGQNTQGGGGGSGGEVVVNGVCNNCTIQGGAGGAGGAANQQQVNQQYAQQGYTACWLPPPWYGNWCAVPGRYPGGSSCGCWYNGRPYYGLFGY